MVAQREMPQKTKTQLFGYPEEEIRGHRGISNGGLEMVSLIAAAQACFAVARARTKKADAIAEQTIGQESWM